MEMSKLKQCKFCVVTVKHDLETRLHFTLNAKSLASYFKCEKCETHIMFWRLDTKSEVLKISKVIARWHINTFNMLGQIKYIFGLISPWSFENLFNILNIWKCLLPQ